MAPRLSSPAPYLYAVVKDAFTRSVVSREIGGSAAVDLTDHDPNPTGRAREGVSTVVRFHCFRVLI